jgi:hypothetical protein
MKFGDCLVEVGDEAVNRPSAFIHRPGRCAANELPSRIPKRSASTLYGGGGAAVNTSAQSDMSGKAVVLLAHER